MDNHWLQTEHYVCTCCGKGSNELEDDRIEHENEQLCETCYNALFKECVMCKKEFHPSELDADDICPICSDHLDNHN